MQTHPNPDLTVGPDARPRWNSAPHRRHGFHNLHRLARYTQGYRAASVLDLRLSANLSIPARDDVARLTRSPWFSAMVVIEGNRVLYETYASDFGPHQPHSIMSISKMSLNLFIGRLVEAGRIDLSARIGDLLPWIGSGYAQATVQQVLNMDVMNAYEEDYNDANTTAFLHEAATGMRLPLDLEPTNREFIAGIGLAKGARDTKNSTGLCDYKSANTDVLAFLAEAASGCTVNSMMADLADAAGVEDVLHVLCDRTGMPALNGGLCLTARDLARYGAVFARMGKGVGGADFGSAAFIRQTLGSGIPMPAPRAHLRYSNQTNTNGIWLGHGGYGGQYLVAHPGTGRVACLLSVLQDEGGYDTAYYPPIITMLSEICAGS